MNDFEVELGDGRTVVVKAPDAEQAAGAARAFLAREKGSQPQGRSDAAAGAFAQGATFGFGDELTAAVRAAFPRFSNWMMAPNAWQKEAGLTGQRVSDAPTFDQRYSDELNRQRAQDDANAKAYPGLTTGAKIAGGVASGVATAPLLPAWLLRGASLPTQVIKGGLVGAGYGGLQGFGEGEGGFTNRAASAVLPAAVGGALGAAAPVVVAGGKAAYDWAAPPVLNKAADILEAMAPGRPLRSLSAAAPDGATGVPPPGMGSQPPALNRLADALRGRAANVTDDAALLRLAGVLDESGGIPAAQARLRILAAVRCLRTRTRPRGDWLTPET